ncbi:MAG TPA: tetratricopeptide repeat protein, partial [Gammaproteobacteria bacterium]|nr:tetratricopeptide repeat protein [Gammaproteobacteria bacterium]
LLCARGRSSDAIDQARPLVESDETGPDLLIALAQAFLEDSQNENSRQQNPAEQARRLAARATEIEPDYWRHHLELGNILFLTGDPLDAQPAYEASIACRPTEVALVNLGMIRVCMGRLDKAREHFEQAHKLKPDAYLGHEYLGTIHFLQRRYGEAIRHYRKAIACFTESDALSIHQIWSSLGDACRLGGEKEAAIEAYLKTIEVIHHDRLQGLDNPGYRLAHYHAWFCLSQLDPARYEADRLEAICKDLPSLLEQPLHPGGLARLSWLLYRQGDLDRSREALKAAVAICPGLMQHPDLSAMLQVTRPEPSTAAESEPSLPSATA